MTFRRPPPVPLSTEPVVLVYDGGCPFCRHFAQRSELSGGIPGLEIRDGRADHGLRAGLKARGFDLTSGAVVINGQSILHGSQAIAWICSHMQPSDPLLKLLGSLFGSQQRSQGLYPLLLIARRMALFIKGLPVDPDAAVDPQAG